MNSVDTLKQETPWPQSARRIPWLAGLMSAMLPGFGQLYNGQVNRAIWFFLAFALALIPANTVASLYVPSWAMLPALLVCLLVSVGAWLTSIVDAYRQARTRQQFDTYPWQTFGLYFIVFILINAMALPSLVNYVRQHQVQAFSIPSTSMEPGLLKGDYLFADMRYNCPTCKHAVARGDAAIFVNPNNRNQYYIKRIVGMPNDHVVIDASGVSVNGSLLSANVTSEVSEETFENRRWTVQNMVAPPTVIDMLIPSGHVFVLGDNREFSKDSREFGTLPLVDIVGKAKQIWFSKSENGIRWNRIGKPVQ